MLRFVSRIKSWMVVYVAMFAVLALADEHQVMATHDSRLSPVSLDTEASRLQIEPRVRRADI